MIGGIGARPRGRRRGAVLAAVALCAGALIGLAPVSAAQALNGACQASSGGVTVVVDFKSLGGGVQVRCVPGGGGSTAASLFGQAGFTLDRVQQFPGAVCTVNGKPADTECVRMPPANAYWALHHASGPGSWSYAQRGVNGLTVPANGFVAFSWVSAPSVAPAYAPGGGSGGGSGGSGGSGGGSGGSGGGGSSSGGGGSSSGGSGGSGSSSGGSGSSSGGSGGEAPGSDGGEDSASEDPRDDAASEDDEDASEEATAVGEEAGEKTTTEAGRTAESSHEAAGEDETGGFAWWILALLVAVGLLGSAIVTTLRRRQTP